MHLEGWRGKEERRLEVRENQREAIHRNTKVNKGKTTKELLSLRE